MNTKKLALRTIGNFLIISSIYLSARTLYVPAKAEVTYFINTRLLQKTYVLSTNTKAGVRGVPSQYGSPSSSQLGGFLGFRKVELLTPESTDFSIVIPSIGANSKIIADVDASDEKTYLEALNHGVAHAKGTKLPGDGGHIFLFAHSTDYIWNVSSYNAVFYLLYKLQAGDEVNIFHKGQRHIYEVTGSRVINPDEVEYISKTTVNEEVTLQTCWPPGTTFKRLLVFAKPKKLAIN